MKWLIIFVLVTSACGGFAWWFFGHSGPRQLDMLDDAYPNEGTAKLIARDVLFDKKNALDLNIWRTTDAKPQPVIFFLYGGGWQSGSKDDYGFAGRAFANKGYVTVLPDYRLYPKVKFPAFLEDSAKALSWVRDNIAQYGGDPDQIFIAGQSAGAYNASMLALDRQWLGREGKTPDFIKGVAALAGPFDFYPFETETSRQSFGDYHNPEMTQPLSFVRADAPPMFLATGLADTTVKPRNSKVLLDKILTAGGDAEYAEYPDMGHLEIMMAVAKPFRYKGPVLDDMIAFFESRQ